MNSPSDDNPFAVWLRPVHSLALRVLRANVVLRSSYAFQDPVCTVVRGLMGEQFRALRCLTGERSCAGCTAAPDCDFARVIGAPDAAGQAAGETTRPFWLQGVPPAHEISSGTSFTASLVVVDDVVPRYPHLASALLDALERIGEDGVCNTVTVVSDVRETLGEVLANARTDARSLRIEARTPLRLRGDYDRSEERCPQAPWLPLLTSAGLERVASIARSFMGVALSRTQLPDFRAVVVRHGGLRPWSGSRYSHRQDQRIPLEALTGGAVVAGDAIQTLAPLLAVMSAVSVGRSTSMGLGHLHVEPVT